jgi:D-inositol-3-phosphate glycosyltransferase
MKILIVGQFAQMTGFARMTRLIAKGLSNLHQVHILGIDCVDVSISAELHGYKLHNNSSTVDVFAEASLKHLINEIQPHVILLYHDAWLIPRFLKPLHQAKHQCIKVAYIPIDGNILQPNIFSVLKELDVLVAFNHFGYQVIEDCAEQIGMANLKPFDSMSIIPHSLDRDLFYPLSNDLLNSSINRLTARKKLFPNSPELWEGFWVLNANRNQPRKRVDLSLQGFAKFAQNKSASVRLFLHMATANASVNIQKLANSLGIAEHLIPTQEGSSHPEVPADHLNLIYNACDVGINTSLGEGWGLVSFEHAATGAPQVVPSHSACAEIWNDAAELLPVIKKNHSNGLLEGGEVSPTDLANALERLYTDPAHYQNLLELGYRVTTRKTYQKDEITGQWQQLFQNLTQNDLVGTI